MAAEPTGTRASAGWETALDDPLHRAPVVGYLRAIRAHFVVCVVIVTAALVGSGVWLAKRTTTYQSTAELLVSPVPETDISLAGLPLLRASGGDPQRPTKTAATLIDTAEVARRASQLINGELSPDQVDSGVTVTPEDGENLVLVEAKVADPVLAASVANAYVHAALDVRRETLRPLVADAIASSRAELDSLADPSSPRGIELQARIGDLQAISDGRDPTLTVAARALPPTSSEGTPAWLVLALALAAGIAIAAAVAILIEILVPGPVNDEDEVQAIIPAPVLTRVPRLVRQPSSARDDDLPAAYLEAFRTLRGQLEFRTRANRRGPDRNGAPGLEGVIAITSPSAEDGKTSVAAGLARAVIAARGRVLLVEANVRNPGLASRLGVEPEADLTALVDPDIDPGAVVGSVPELPGLEILLARRIENLRAAERLTAAIPGIIERVRAHADCVIIDSPPLALASDALPILRAADQFVLTVRLRNTQRGDVIAATELLDQHDLTAAGLVIVESPLVDAGPPLRGALERARAAMSRA
jgi:Mrp family chromosome partitioning ATPase/capsular polysaccharide biosynthesis protein